MTQYFVRPIWSLQFLIMASMGICRTYNCSLLVNVTNWNLSLIGWNYCDLFARILFHLPNGKLFLKFFNSRVSKKWTF